MPYFIANVWIKQSALLNLETAKTIFLFLLQKSSSFISRIRSSASHILYKLVPHISFSFFISNAKTIHYEHWQKIIVTTEKMIKGQIKTFFTIFWIHLFLKRFLFIHFHAISTYCAIFFCFFVCKNVCKYMTSTIGMRGRAFFSNTMDFLIIWWWKSEEEVHTHTEFSKQSYELLVLERKPLFLGLLFLLFLLLM